MRVLAARPEVGFVEGRFVPGVPGPPLHRHSWSESFYVISGQLSLILEDAERLLNPGDFALAGSDEFHTFAVHGTQPVVFVAGFHPGVGLDYVMEMTGVMEPAGPDPEGLAMLYAKYGISGKS